MRVFLDHRLVREHPKGSTLRDEAGVLVIREPDGTEIKYQPGEWHGAGFVCGFINPRDACPNCNAGG